MLLAVALFVSFARAADVLAVAYFDSNSVRPELEPLGRGVADMLTTDLGSAPGVRVVERQRLAEVLAELQLGKGGFVDPATAQTLGRGLGATAVVVGSVTVAIEGMRVDARVIDVASGVVRASAQATGREDEFFKLEAEVARELLAGMGLTASVSERVISLDSIVSGSRAIDAADAALLGRLRGLREYKSHRLVRVAFAGTWVVSEGATTPLTARQFAERVGDKAGLERMAASGRKARNTGVALIVSGVAAGVASALFIDAGLDLDRRDPGDDLGAGALFTGGILAGCGGIAVLPSGFALLGAPKTAGNSWIGNFYTPEQAEAVLRTYNTALATDLGVSESDTLTVELGQP